MLGIDMNTSEFVLEKKKKKEEKKVVLFATQRPKQELQHSEPFVKKRKKGMLYTALGNEVKA